MSPYLFGHDWEQERRRLDLLEQVYDHGTRALLEEGTFDLVHSRLVLEHIPGRDRALLRLVAALRPGGWLVLEDFDWLRPSAAPNCVGGELIDRAHDGARQLLAAAGYREDYGVALPGEMRSAGLVDIGAEGRAAVGVAGSPATAWWQLTMTRWCAGLIELGCLTEAEADEVLALFDDDGVVFRLPTLVTVWGRCPVSSKGRPE